MCMTTTGILCAALMTAPCDVVPEPTTLGPDVRAEVEALGVRIRVGESILCELSIYGQLFIARCGPGLAVEYRVRDADVALRALDQILRANGGIQRIR